MVNKSKQNNLSNSLLLDCQDSAHQREVFIIPTNFGGGAEKIFNILRSNVILKDRHIYFFTIWKSECSYLLNSEFPSNVLSRLVGAAWSAWVTRDQLTQPKSHLIAFLPLGLLTGAMCKILSRTPSKLTYCRRNNYRRFSLNRFLEHLFIRFAERVVFCSVESVIKLRPYQSSAICNNPIPAISVATTTDGSNICICMVGRLVVHKRPLLGLQSFAQYKFKNQQFSVYLDVLGLGPLTHEIKNTIRAFGMESDISLLGFVKQPFSEPDYRILLHPSEYEGSPNTIFEAIANGLIVICKNDLEGLADLDPEIRDKFFVFVDESRQDVIDAWAMAIKQSVLLSQKHSRQDLMNFAKRFSETESQFAQRFFMTIRNE